MKQPLPFVWIALLFLFSAQLAGAQTGSKSGTGANIDVVYHRAEWRINPDSATGSGVLIKNIKGTVTTYFKTKQADVSAINFDLDKAAFNNANLIVKYHGSATGVVKSFPTSGNVNILNITLPVTLPINTLDSVTISYSGAPPAFSTYGEGYDQKSITGMGNVVYTLAESYGDDDWWPCKADMQDKVDSMDFIISMPSAFRAATNGALISDVISGASRIMTYKHRYPIASYLVAVGVAKYTVFNRTPVNINGTSVPIMYYVYSGRTPTPAQLTTMDYCKDQMMAFSSKYGDYPFKNEKYGMYEFGWGGGMEHQTFSAMGWTSMINWSVIAHELAHQWFGDKVTFATWNHLWLAEGFAKYSEVLAAELVTTMGQNPVTHRSGIKSKALSTSTTPIYLSNASIANSNTIWTTANDDAIYQRGAMVVSMLRKLAGDTKFFQALKNYLANPALAYKSATTENLRDHFEAVLGYDLDAFFTDYIYGTGNPAYDINWGNSGTGINIELTTQRRSTSSTVPYFRTPVVLKISNGTKDTTVIIYDENGKVSYAGDGIQQPHSGKILGYQLSFVPTTVTVDPLSETLVRGQDGTTARSTVATPTRLDYAPTILYEPMQVMPVTIVDFKGQRSASGNLLSLVQAATSERVAVVAERSENGSTFTAIGEMVNGGFSEKGNLYTLEDETFSNAHVRYYRARTVDEAGMVKYSKVISLRTNSESGGGVSIRPNVVTDVLKIILSEGWERKAASVIVYNSAGQAVKQERYNAAASLQVPVRGLPAGRYNVQVAGPDGKAVSKPFIIVR